MSTHTGSVEPTAACDMLPETSPRTTTKLGATTSFTIVVEGGAIVGPGSTSPAGTCMNAEKRVATISQQETPPFLLFVVSKS